MNNKNLTRKGNEWEWKEYHKWKSRHEYDYHRKRIINRNTKVFGMGSCFAENVIKMLNSKGVKSDFFPSNCRYYDILAIKQVFEHIFDRQVYGKEDMWFTSEGLVRHPFRWPGKLYDNIDRLLEEDKKINELAKKLIVDANVIAITVGGAELWRNPVTKKGYTTIPFPDIFNSQMPDVAEVHMLTFDEHIKCVKYMHKIIRRVNQSAEIIFTVSPHRMTFTVSNKNVVEATCQGKSTIRAALGEYIDSSGDDKLHYFHSYEIVEYSEHPELLYDHQFRHVNSFAVELVMSNFFKIYCDDQVFDEKNYVYINEAFWGKGKEDRIKGIMDEQRVAYNVLGLVNRISRKISVVYRTIWNMIK